MPVILHKDLPARAILESENIPVLEKPSGKESVLRVAVLNLMPTKIDTETQLARLLANTAHEVDITWLRPATHISKNTDPAHLEKFYTTHADIKGQHFDGLIITGAPVEQLPFTEVNYWEELCDVIDWAETNVRSSLFVCWGAQAALYRRYEVPKYQLPEKMFGVFEHHVLTPNEPIVRGMNDITYAPHSRHTEVRREDIEKHPDLQILIESDEAGVYMVATKRDKRDIFISGHSEYDRYTLNSEHVRDKDKGLHIPMPKNYFPEDNDAKEPIVRWKEHAHLLFANWLNHYVARDQRYIGERPFPNFR